MQVVKYPVPRDWAKLLQRPVLDSSSLEASVVNILREVKTSGDEAVRRFSLMFDKVVVENPVVSKADFVEAQQQIDEPLKVAILQAKANIEKFHRQQQHSEERIEPMPGVVCWRKAVPIEKVGLYIPGGTAPLFSTILMLGIPAAIAGCQEIILCTPPNQEGKVHPAILYTASLVGITKVFRIGGVQAIGAMAYGTKTIPQVYKIFGPGNQYVTCAKQLVNKEGVVAIDMPAGPSEVMVLADETAIPVFVAADLLSQAEHGADSQVMLVTTEESLLAQVQTALAVQLEQLPRKELAAKALANSKAILVKTQQEAIALINEYAPEHLLIACKEAEAIASQIINAGSVFLGNYSPESVGDYASGTNHTLPTNGYARAYSGVSLDSFVKKITYQQLTERGLQNIGPSVETMAAAEGLEGHRQAVNIRLQWIKQNNKN